VTPDHLLTFAAVAEHLNISHAARALFLSQPAVSGQLRLLQEEFGEALYRREGRGIVLTAAGRQLALHAERMRGDFRQALAFRDALRSLEAGHLRIGASTTPASYLLPALIAEFHKRYGGVTIATRYGNSAEVLAALPELDIALIEGTVGENLPPGTSVHRWREDEIVAVVPASHPLAARPERQVRLDELADYLLVLREVGSGVRQTVERAFAREGVMMRIAYELAGVEGIKEAVRAGMGVGFVSAMSMRHEDGALVALSVDGPHRLTRYLSVVVPHGAAPLRATERFVALCLDWE
jgi:DNA-binding transcriptional LysR family regulator